MKFLIRWFVENPVATNLLMLILVVGGAMTLPTIHQEEFPNIEADAISIVVPYLGASPAEVEKAVCIRIEEAIEGSEGIKRISTTASEGRCQIVVELVPNFDKGKALIDIKGKVDAIDSFPVEADKPVVRELTMLTKVLEVVVSGDTDERSLKELGERMREDLLVYPDVSQVSLAYTRAYEIAIEVSEENLRRYGITLAQVADAVRANSIDLPGGSIKSVDGEILLRTTTEATTVEQYEQIVVLTQPDGSNVYLHDIADVRDGFEDSDVKAVFNGKPAIVLDVRHIGHEDVLDVAAKVKEYVASSDTRFPEGIDVTIWQDESQDLVDRLDVLGTNARTGLLLVLLVLALFLQTRLALWVAAGIPIALMGTMLVFPFFDMSISTLSVMGVIVVLGILVDDAIVVGERIYAHEQLGKPRMQAAIEGTQEVSIPVIFGVLTTMTAFTPVMAIPSDFGKLFGGIGVTAVIALFFSLVESQLILPMHIAHRKQSKEKEESAMSALAQRWNALQERLSSGLVNFATYRYRPALLKVMYWRYTAAAVAVAALIVILSLFASGRMVFQFFPSLDGNRLYAQLSMPEGTPVEVTSLAVAQIEEAAEQLKQEQDALREPGQPSIVKHVMASIGKVFSRGSIASDGTIGAHRAEIGIELDIPPDHTGTPPSALAARWRELTGVVPDAVELTFTAEAFSAGKAIDIEFRGDDMEELKQAAAQLRQALQSYPGIYDISDTWRGGKQEVQLKLLPEARNLGLTATDLARQVRHAFYGEEVQRIQRGREDVKVMVRFPEGQRRSMGDLEDMRIRTAAGDEVPFASVAQVELDSGYSNIVRKDGRRIIRVMADVDRSVISPEEIIASLEASELPEIIAQFNGLGYGLSGEAEEAAEANESLIVSATMAMLVIYALLSIPLKSYWQPVVIMSVIPFGFMGAVIGHFLMGIPLMFFSLLGIVALSGVVVNSSLVLVDSINRARSEGVELSQAVANSGVARFRPIVLTSITTFVGLVPLIISTNLSTMMFTPMAISLAFGVLFATVITLFLVPCFYLILEDGKRAWHGSEPVDEVTAQP